MKEEIITLLNEKAGTKQDVYRKTKSVFVDFQTILKEIAKELQSLMKKSDASIKVSYSSKGSFEAQLKLSGETLLFHMHSNVFDFSPSHAIKKTSYIKKDNLRSFCGVINIYSFLSDSLKYNRLNDEGYLVGRIFINKDNHFLVEGERQLGFLFSDFERQIIDKKHIESIVNAAIMFALSEDLMIPNFKDVQTVIVHQILQMSNNQKIKTAKRLGYKFSHENK